MSDPIILDVDYRYGVDPAVGARQLITTTWSDGKVTGEGSWTPNTIDCSEATWIAAVTADAEELAGWHEEITAHSAAWNAANPNRFDSLVGNYPPPPGT